MGIPESRRWTDTRDGTEWRLVYEPGTEDGDPAVHRMGERILMIAGDQRLEIPAVYGSDLASLADRDLEGLLDQARGPDPVRLGGRPAG